MGVKQHSFSLLPELAHRLHFIKGSPSVLHCRNKRQTFHVAVTRLLKHRINYCNIIACVNIN